MAVLVLVASGAALMFPGVLEQVPTTVINPLLGVIMFGMGLTLNLKDFKIVFSRPKDVIIGCLAQFTIMPLLAWGLAKVFRLDEALALGVVLVGCCPGGTASNVITYLAKGGLAIVIVVMFHNLCGLGLGYLIGRLLGLTEPKKRAISIEVGMQNSGLASALASLHFAAYPMATIPGAIFSVWHNISGAIVARLFTRKND